jgi:hypothetical protein
MAAEAAIHATIGVHNARRKDPFPRVVPSALRMLKLAWMAACAAMTLW